MTFSHFLGEHILYVIIFLVLLFSYTIVEIKVTKAASFRLSIKDSVLLINKKKTLVFDLRAASDYKKSHIAQATNIKKEDLLNRCNGLIKDKSANVILICASDTICTETATKLNKKGFKNVKFLGDGMKAWEKEQMPISKGLSNEPQSNKNKKSSNSKKKKPTVTK